MLECAKFIFGPDPLGSLECMEKGYPLPTPFPLDSMYACSISFLVHMVRDVASTNYKLILSKAHVMRDNSGPATLAISVGLQQ